MRRSGTPWSQVSNVVTALEPPHGTLFPVQGANVPADQLTDAAEVPSLDSIFCVSQRRKEEEGKEGERKGQRDGEYDQTMLNKMLNKYRVFLKETGKNKRVSKELGTSHQYCQVSFSVEFLQLHNLT